MLSGFAPADRAKPGDLTFAHVRAFVDELVTVEEEAIVEAVQFLFRRLGLPGRRLPCPDSLPHPVHLRQSLRGSITDAQIDQAVGQHPAHQKFHG